jgi:predicted DsbA family dithiol-disulfide isomerase
VRAAADVGLNPEIVRPLLESDEDVEEITLTADAAKQAGISGVPTFIIDGKYVISGAHPSETLAQVIRKAATEG